MKIINKYLLHITYVAVPLHCSTDEPKLADFNAFSMKQISY